MKSFAHIFSNRVLFENQLLHYFRNTRNIVLLTSNKVAKTDLLGISDSDEIKSGQWQFGFIAYDYKNQIEKLSSKNFDGIQFPEKHFFTPELLFEIGHTEMYVHFNSLKYSKEQLVKLLFKIEESAIQQKEITFPQINARETKEEYLEKINQIQKHIQLGDIYEMNYCQEFYAEDVQLNPIEIYFRLNKKSLSPFSCFVKCEDKYLMSASPERFIQKIDNKICSQPIKGTIKRGKTGQEDDELKEQLYNDTKERRENVMIVDLVRNDLAKIAMRNSVKVDELCGIYSFEQLHQMISTVSAQLRKSVTFEGIIKAMFPMGSMTGAPKIRAMELIEQLETTKRGLYSGSVGYIKPAGDFDFNVVIRSILYNQENSYLSFMVGGAITALSNPEKEYEECMLKAKAMFEVLALDNEKCVK